MKQSGNQENVISQRSVKKEVAKLLVVPAETKWSILSMNELYKTKPT